MLNGWPIVNFGVGEARRIRRASRVPLTLNSTDEDGRLASEIALAAGWNAANTRSLQECVAHCKDIPLEDEIRINQYESRLAAIYTERGVPICTHNACNLTGRCPSCGCTVEVEADSDHPSLTHGYFRHEDGCPVLLDEDGKP